jgi:uncharacterized metal-binding protein YceD (DUF177 family)
MPKLRDMAGRSEQLIVDIRLQDLPRLKGLLYPEHEASDQLIRLQFVFGRGAQGFPEINGSASGFINLRCQRCLGSLSWPVDLAFNLAVAESEEELAASSEPFDTVLATDGVISLLELTEDELLASLPLAPMHENLEDCELKGLLANGAGSSLDRLDVAGVQPAVAAPEDDVRRPFSGLSSLLKQKGNP